MHLGNNPLIVVNDNDSVHRALYHRDFDGRPDILMGRLRDPKLNLHGIFFMEGDVWHEQRRFTLRYLRDFGFGRRYEILEKEIQIQIAQFIDLVKNGPKYPHEEVMMHVVIATDAQQVLSVHILHFKFICLCVVLIETCQE